MQFDPLDRPDPTVKHLKFQKSKMAAAAILEKLKYCYISAAVRAILKKIDLKTQFDPLDRCDR